MRAESCVIGSSTWPAKNNRAVSMIANRSAKKTGATSANSSAADARRLRRKRRSSLRIEPVEETEACMGSSGLERHIILSERSSGNSLGKRFLRYGQNGCPHQRLANHADRSGATSGRRSRQHASRPADHWPSPDRPIRPERQTVRLKRFSLPTHGAAVKL